MRSDTQKPESVDVLLVEFAFYNTSVHDSTNLSGKSTVLFWLPADLLWSSHGLAQMFEITREAWLGPETGDHDEEWETWHLVTIHDEDADSKIVVNVDWAKAVPKRAAGKD